MPLRALCAQRGWEWEWDPHLQAVTVLPDKGPALKVLVGMDSVLLGDELRPLGKDVLLKEGSILVPAAILALLPLEIPPQTAPRIQQTAVPPVEAQPGQSFRIRRVVIDPGHGGKDPGALGRNGLQEKVVVLSIAKKLAEELRAQGIQVILTREDDRFIPLQARAEFANKHKADFFLSIHANSAHAKSAQGFEIYYLSEATDDNARALASAENSVDGPFEDEAYGERGTDLDATVWDLIHTENRIESIELAHALMGGLRKHVKVEERGVKSARFAVLRGTQMPSLLLEVGFVSNNDEGKRLSDPWFQKKIAQGIASGLLNYKREYERTNGFTK